MSKPSILIIGAGAVGLAVGYHLSLADADITFLVRPGRSAAFASPQQLYCYDDASLKTFAGYSVVENVAELAQKRFQFVIVTLDGHTSRTAEGTALLRSLGDAIRASDATVIMGGFGVGLREHYLQVMRIAEDRLLKGFLVMLSHQANAVFPMYAASEITGWPDVAMVVANKELWRLACRAQGEIIALPQHGWLGKLMALIMGPRVTANIHLRLERDMLPLDYQAFNRFQHGGKVRAQDVELLRDCLAEGQRRGQPMAALQALLAKLSAHEAASQAVTQG